MDPVKLSRIDEELESAEVAALCFLCRDVVERRRLEGITDGKVLFRRLDEKCLLDNDTFLYQLLHTIKRKDLLSLLETDSRRPEETSLSEYRMMLYKVYEDMTQDNLEKMKFLLEEKLKRRQTEMCKTALDVFVEMERINLMSTTNVVELHTVLQRLDQQLALTVQRYMDGLVARAPNAPQVPQPMEVSISETNHSNGVSAFPDAGPPPPPQHDKMDYYDLVHVPRGQCVLFNNEDFTGPMLGKRMGTQEDARVLKSVFSRFGFTVQIHDNLTAAEILHEIQILSERNFQSEDALVVCVLSHGDIGCVFGTDEKEVSLQELTQPFNSWRAPTLAGKPKLFFIQACQGKNYQRGATPVPPTPRQQEAQTRLEEDAGRVQGNTVPYDADVLLGMATVPNCKSFRHTYTGSIYIQQLCAQLEKSAESAERDDILTVLTRVNREVALGEYNCYKQMPEPKYTLTKKLVLKFV